MRPFMESGAWRAFSRGDGMTDIAPLDLFDNSIKKNQCYVSNICWRTLPNQKLVVKQ
jgi:hypothetical protein